MATAKATAKKPAPKKPVSAKQASAVADMLKSQKAGGNGSGSKDVGPAQPTPKQNPVTTDDDQDDAE